MLHKSQSGFRAKHSTESALILMVDSWLKALNAGKLVGCVMVDFRKAFDLVDHQILLKKIQSYKCSYSCLSWFKSYLFHRTQRVAINNELSETSKLSCGVPQGSILCLYYFYFSLTTFPYLCMARLLPIYMHMTLPYTSSTLIWKLFKAICKSP